MNRFFFVCFIGVFCVLWLFSSIVFAQDIEIQDGGTATLNSMSYSGTVTSTTATDNSTAILSTSGSVYLFGTLTEYYGVIRPNNASTLYFSSLTSAPANLIVGYSASSTTTFIKQNGAFSFTGTDGSSHTVELQPYGVFDLSNVSNSGNLTLANSLYISSYNDANAGYIKYALAMSGGEDATKRIAITTGRVLTDDTAGQINAATHLLIDFSNISLSGISTGTKRFTLATGSTDFYVTNSSSPNVTGNDNGLWESISIITNDEGYNMKVQATFAPGFQLNNDSYVGTWSDMISDATEGATQTILKSQTLTSDVTMSKSLILSLGNYNISTGENAFVISDSKYLGLSSTGSGVFSGYVNFSGITSTLKVLSSSILNSSFYVEASSSASGMIEIGDGSTSTSQSFNTSQFNSQVSKITVKTNASLTLTSS